MCKGFLLSNAEDIIKEFYRIMVLIEGDVEIERLLSVNIPYIYLSNIEEYNAIFGQQQLENIASTLNIISSNNKRDKLENMKKNNIQKCINWCLKYNLPYNKTISNSNAFLHNRIVYTEECDICVA